MALDKQEIDAENDALVVFLDVRGQRDGRKNWDSGGGASTRRLSFKRGDIGAVDGRGALGVVGSKRAVEKVAVGEEFDEIGVAWTAEHAIEPASGVSLFDIATREKRFLFGDSGQKSVGFNFGANDITGGVENV